MAYFKLGKLNRCAAAIRSRRSSRSLASLMQGSQLQSGYPTCLTSGRMHACVHSIAPVILHFFCTTLTYALKSAAPSGMDHGTQHHKLSLILSKASHRVNTLFHRCVNYPALRALPNFNLWSSRNDTTPCVSRVFSIAVASTPGLGLNTYRTTTKSESTYSNFPIPATHMLFNCSNVTGGSPPILAANF